MVNNLDKDSDYTRNEVIELDSDTKEEELGEGSLYPYDPTFSTIEMSEEPFTVFEYLRKLTQEKIITQPDFQRNLVWIPKKKSTFIESIILNFPIPPIYLNETVDGKYLIIDGLQRTTALSEFYANKFALSELEAMPKYNGKSFQDLSPELQTKFEDKKLTIFLLKPSTPIKIIYDLFNRINTGGTQLNRQEVRNCIYMGKSTALLKELAEKQYFKKAIDNGVSSVRMKDRELILRYISFRWFYDNTNYDGDMSTFVEHAMKKINLMEESEIKEIVSDFEIVMNASRQIWAERSFRIPTPYTRGMINTAVFESVGKFLSQYEKQFLIKNKETLIRNYNSLLEDITYLDAVTSATGAKSKVNDRFRIANEILNRGLA